MIYFSFWGDGEKENIFSLLKSLKYYATWVYRSYNAISFFFRISMTRIIMCRYKDIFQYIINYIINNNFESVYFKIQIYYYVTPSTKYYRSYLLFIIYLQNSMEKKTAIHCNVLTRKFQGLYFTFLVNCSLPHTHKAAALEFGCVWSN